MVGIQAALPMFLLAQQPARQSLLSWALNSLGLFYGAVLPLAGLLVFVGAVVVVFASRRPAVIAAYLTLIPLPIFIGVFGTVHGMISSFSVIAASTSTPTMSMLSEGISMALFTSFFGLLLSFPSYFVTSIGLLVRTILYRDREQK